MKNKIIFSIILAVCVLHSKLVMAGCSEAQFLSDFSAFGQIPPFSSVTNTVCGQQVTLTKTTGGAGIGGVQNGLALIYAGQSLQFTGPAQIAVNGTVVWSGTLLTPADFFAFRKALNMSVSLPYLSSKSMASTSPAVKVNETVNGSVIQTRSQRRQEKQNNDPLNVSLGDVKYDHGDFRHANDSGNIVGFTAKASYDFNQNYSLGILIPYEYMGFNTFDAHRTGVILYGKGKWDLSNNFELNTTINSNYLYTAMQYKSGNGQIHTVGSGLGVRLIHDDGGDFVPVVAVSLQYSKDANITNTDNQQLLVKVGPTLGYRILDNALIQISGAYNRGFSLSSSLREKIVDTDFFDMGIEGNWFISDTWQLKGGFKKVVGLNYYDSDSFYLGSSIKF